MTLAWSETLPTAEEYVALRKFCRMGLPTLQAAELGLSRSIYSVSLRDGETLVGFARLIGDGGCYAELVDVMVRDEHRGRGHGGALVDRCLDWAYENLPESCFVSLIAAPRAEGLYARKGFERRVGMALTI